MIALIIGIVCILGYIGLMQILKKKKHNKKYKVMPVDLIFGTSAYSIFFAINSIRNNYNLEPVVSDFTMNNLARTRCEEMIKLGKLSHELAANDFGFLINLGVDIVSENIAYGYNTIPALIKAWMESPSHRKNILNPNWNLVGISIVLDSNNKPYYCTIFGNDK